MSAPSDQWNPHQYSLFKDQRAKPFHDLLALVQRRNISRAVDLGCGTGELTRLLHQELKSQFTIGLDSSAKMLEEAKAQRTDSVEFRSGDIGDFAPGDSFDLVFSNAALQWVPDHEELFPRLMAMVSSDGQVAIQMPYNFDHPSHRLAREIAAKLFPERFPESETRTPVLALERYSEMLFANGFMEQNCMIKIYEHPVSSGREVIEWTKGTTLTAYQGRLSNDEFIKFLDRYSQELLALIGIGPYFYTFKRMLLWGARSPKKL